MNIESLLHSDYKFELDNDYSIDLGFYAQLCITYAGYDDGYADCYIDLSNPLELETFKDNLEAMLLQVTEAYNYTKGFNI